MSARAKKLPSGAWRCQVYDYTDESGKQHRISFTAPTKAMAEQQAAAYMAKKGRVGRSVNMTVNDAVKRYIAVKEGVLSPSTVANYIHISERYYTSIGRRKIYSLGSADLQVFVSDLTTQGLSPKSVKNIYGLLISSITMFMPEAAYRVSLPKKARIDYSVPEAVDVRKLVENAKYPLNLAILLGACGMRRGEICAIKYGDVNRRARSIHVHADMVINRNKEYEYKPTPKTSHSIRMVPVTDEVLDLIGSGMPDAFVFQRSPDWLTKNFHRLRNSLGMSCRFHDLRHYYATIMASKVPRAYIEEFGGWSPGSRVLDSVYTNTQESARTKYADRVRKNVL